MGKQEGVDELFEGRHFDREVMILCVRWYLQFKLGLRDLVEMMAERGLSLAHTTIMRWVQRYARSSRCAGNGLPGQSAGDGGSMRHTSRSGASGATCTSDPAMVKALARAFRWKRLLEAGRYSSISEIAAAEMIDRGCVGNILRLTLLAPDIIEAIMDGRQPDGLGLPALPEPFSQEWDQQRIHWLIAADRPGRPLTLRHRQ